MDAFTKERLADGEACLKAALYYLSLGWSVLSICPADHVGVGKYHANNCEHPGKRPLGNGGKWKEYQERLPTKKEIEEWWREHSGCNVGIALGPVSGLVRIDVEGDGGEAKLAEMSGGDLPNTLEFTSGRNDGGRGLLYKIPEGVVPDTTYENVDRKQEVRFQAKGAETVLPPSKHVSGRKYVWKSGHGPADREAALMPAWLVAEMTKKRNGQTVTGRPLDEWFEILKGVQEGERNQTAASLAGKMLGMVANIDDTSQTGMMLALMRMWNEQNDPPMTDEELVATWASIHRAESARRKNEDLKHLDNHIMLQVKATPPEPPTVGVNGHARIVLPDWHLVIVESEPAEFRLRAPFWKDSERLKNGYISLTEDEILWWNGAGRGVPRQAWRQAHEIVADKIKSWSKPGGQLDILKKNAQHVLVSPEAQRKLYVMGYLYRYIAAAIPAVKAGQEKPTWPSSGRPVLFENNVFFKFLNLKRAIKEHKEDLKQPEVLSIMRECGMENDFPDGKRWWKVSRENATKMAKNTDEARDGFYFTTAYSGIEVK